MKFNFRKRAARGSVAAMAPVVGMLVAAAFAKFGVASQLLHLSH